MYVANYLWTIYTFDEPWLTLGVG